MLTWNMHYLYFDGMDNILSLFREMQKDIKNAMLEKKEKYNIIAFYLFIFLRKIALCRRILLHYHFFLFSFTTTCCCDINWKEKKNINKTRQAKSMTNNRRNPL